MTDFNQSGAEVGFDLGAPLDEIEDWRGGDFRPIPEGVYTLMPVHWEVEDEPNRDGETNVVIDFKVCDSAPRITAEGSEMHVNGKEMKDWFGVGPKGQGKVKALLLAMYGSEAGIPVNPQTQVPRFVPAQLMGKMGRALIIQKSSQGTNKETGAPMTFINNRIARWLKPDEDAPDTSSTASQGAAKTGGGFSL